MTRFPLVQVQGGIQDGRLLIKATSEGLVVSVDANSESHKANKNALDKMQEFLKDLESSDNDFPLDFEVIEKERGMATKVLFSKNVRHLESVK